MAFNGSAHFKPGELVSYFESIGARLGPHVNAYTSFDETVYMLDLPTDKPEIVGEGADGARRFRRRADARSRSRSTRNAASSSRSGAARLGAGSRIRDKQIPGALPRVALRRAAADRQARDHPQRAGGAAARVLRHLVPARADGGRRRRRHRSAADRSRHPGGLRSADGARAGRRPRRTARCRCTRELLGQRRHRPRGHAVVRADHAQAAARRRPSWSATTAAVLVERLFEHMFNERFGELVAQARRASSSAPAVGGGGLSPTVEPSR